eukprot:COSAG06_NODE_386_length_16443_cov_314.441936_24_plen_141_part_00
MNPAEKPYPGPLLGYLSLSLEGGQRTVHLPRIPGAHQCKLGGRRAPRAGRAAPRAQRGGLRVLPQARALLMHRVAVAATVLVLASSMALQLAAAAAIVDVAPAQAAELAQIDLQHGKVAEKCTRTVCVRPRAARRSTNVC